jgi:hypothetical protein
MMADGHLNHCKDCVKARVREHRATNPKVQEYDRWRYHNHPHRKNYAKKHPAHIKKAHYTVGNAIRAGKLTRPNICEECGQERFTEAAHSDYSRPLDVRWLCVSCHRRWDALEPKH